MGKNKKPQKTKELSVAIAEASSTGDETQQQPQQVALIQSPRKRGRPRKIVEKIENEEKNKEQTAVAQAYEGVVETETETQSKRVKTSEEEQEEEVIKAEATSASIEGTKKKGGQSSVGGEPSKEPPSRSRARRKGKPRKSS